MANAHMETLEAALLPPAPISARAFADVTTRKPIYLQQQQQKKTNVNNSTEEAQPSLTEILSTRLSDLRALKRANARKAEEASLTAHAHTAKFRLLIGDRSNTSKADTAVTGSNDTGVGSNKRNSGDKSSGGIGGSDDQSNGNIGKKSSTTLAERLAQTSADCDALERRIAEAGSAAVSLGSQLRLADRQRCRALEARELIFAVQQLGADSAPTLVTLGERERDSMQTLLDFFLHKLERPPTEHYHIKESSAESSEQAKLFRLKSSEQREIYSKVVLAKKLNSLADELQISPQMQKAVTNIRLISAQLEQDLLERFTAASLDSNLKKMRELAFILREFNNGESCMDRCITLSDMFNEDGINNDEQLAARAIDSKKFADDRLAEFFDSLRLQLRTHRSLFSRVFSEPGSDSKDEPRDEGRTQIDAAMAMLIVRIFSKRLPRFLEAAVTPLLRSNPQTYLRSLAFASVQVAELGKHLQQEYPLATTEDTFDGLSDTLWKPFRMEYIAIEARTLASGYRAALSDAGFDSRSNETATLSAQNNSSDPSILSFLETALEMIKLTEESIKRCLLVSRPADVPNNLVVLFRDCLLEILGREFALAVLSRAVIAIPERPSLELAHADTSPYALSRMLQRLPLDASPATSRPEAPTGAQRGPVTSDKKISNNSKASKAEASASVTASAGLNNLTASYARSRDQKATSVLSLQLRAVADAFEAMYFTNQIVLFLQKHYFISIVPHLLSAPNEHTLCEVGKEHLWEHLEDMVAVGLSRGLTVLCQMVQRLLQGQRKEEWDIPEFTDGAETQYDPSRMTPTCASVCSVLRAVEKLFKANLDGMNLTNLLEEFGVRCHALLLEHCMRQRVSQGLGALQLLRDLTEYRDVARAHICQAGDAHFVALADVTDRFELLRDISNLHLVAPENIREVWQESRLADLTTAEVQRLVAMRSDYKNSWKAKFLREA